ncbi:DUF2000 domain-containing protein [Kiloniella antarctica]|uniref:DUF2000 domain-containing protein n=1 Tax=Kiloniella antarctica TaxID=1550907 RepID=A0ABW5BMK7_9PROT
MDTLSDTQAKTTDFSPQASTSKITTTHKCVIVIDQDLPLGIIANTAAVLSLSIGHHHPEMIGIDISDNAGDLHHGITILPVPILKGTAASLLALRETLKAYEPSLTVIDLISATRTTQDYKEYSHVMASTSQDQLIYSGIALFGAKKLVNKFTGNLGLLR